MMVPLLTVWCRERGGPRLRSVIRLPKNIGQVLDVAKKMRRVRSFLPRDEEVLSLIAWNSDVFLVDDVGILAAVDIQYGVTAHVHMTFWDGKLRGREELVGRMAEYLMDIHMLDFVWTAIPEKHRFVIAFCKRVGFTVFSNSYGVLGMQLAKGGTPWGSR